MHSRRRPALSGPDGTFAHAGASPQPDVEHRLNRPTYALAGSHARQVSSLLDELLPAVDVVSAACKGCVSHDVNGERGYVGRANDAPDRERSAELLAAGIKLIAEQRC